MQIPDLLRDLSRNLVGPHRVLVGSLAIAKVESSEYEWE